MKKNHLNFEAAIVVISFENIFTVFDGGSLTVVEGAFNGFMPQFPNRGANAPRLIL